MKIVEHPPLLLVGQKVALPLRHADVPERVRRIQELARAFYPRAHEIPHRIGRERYNVIENDVLDTGATPLFRTTVAVSSLEGQPDWVEAFTLPATRFAVFEHRGLPRDLGKTVAAIQSTYGSQVPGLFSIDLELCVYPPDYDPTDPNGAFAYWLPLP